jgi:small GTP-binding protein
MISATQKAKICLIGATAVGKSSLVARFARSTFSEEYRTTIGVKIETRRIQRNGRDFELVVWDLSGEDEFQTVQPSYLRGAWGYLLVVDGTRKETKDVALVLAERVARSIGRIPHVVVLNKKDQVASWDLSDRDLEAFRRSGAPIIETSARTGAGVALAFDRLVDAILEEQPWS